MHEGKNPSGFTTTLKTYSLQIRAVKGSFSKITCITINIFISAHLYLLAAVEAHLIIYEDEAKEKKAMLLL